MNQPPGSALCLKVVNTSVFADARLGANTTQTGEGQTGSEQIALLLNAKQPDAQAVRGGSAALGEEVEDVQTLVVTLGEVDPQFVQGRDNNFGLPRRKAQSPAGVHRTKDELMRADEKENNRLLPRSHAEGVAAHSSLLRRAIRRLR